MKLLLALLKAPCGKDGAAGRDRDEVGVLTFDCGVITCWVEELGDDMLEPRPYGMDMRRSLLGTGDVFVWTVSSWGVAMDAALWC